MQHCQFHLFTELSVAPPWQFETYSQDVPQCNIAVCVFGQDVSLVVEDVVLPDAGPTWGKRALTVVLSQSQDSLMDRLRTMIIQLRHSCTQPVAGLTEG